MPVAGAVRQSAPTPRCLACPIPRGFEGLPKEDSPRPSGRRVSERTLGYSVGPDVLALRVGSNGDGASQRTTVSGCTTIKAVRQSRHALAIRIQNSRSRSRSGGRLAVRLNTANG